MSSDITPHPPATAEFGRVVPGGPTHRYAAKDGVDVRKFSVGDFDNNVYVVASRGEAVIVDGAADAPRILSEVEGLRVVAILETHDHWDHVQALGELVAALGAPVFAHPSDPMPVPFEPIEDGHEVRVGASSIRVMHTPGHTPGSTCYLLRSFLFSGDTLFPGGPGRTDGPAEFAQVMRSLDRIFELPDETRVAPGHGLDTTIGRERPYLEVWRRRGW
jgi:glyoxylase-like metal-dependent hydrolase (beta-lactamase superfamily II)